MSVGVGRKGYVLGEGKGGEEKSKGRRVNRTITVDVEVTRNDKVRGRE